MMCDKDRIPVEEAARRMGMTPQTLRMGMRAGRFPFGEAWQMRRRWVYYINRSRFERYMAGADMGGDADAVSTASIRAGDDGRRPGRDGGGQAPSPARPAS